MAKTLCTLEYVAAALSRYYSSFYSGHTVSVIEIIFLRGSDGGHDS